MNPSLAQTRPSLLAGPFGEADLEGDRFGTVLALCSYPPEPIPTWQVGQSDIFELTVPPGEFPGGIVSSSIDEALRNALDQVPGAPSVSELPYRVSKKPSRRK